MPCNPCLKSLRSKGLALRDCPETYLHRSCRVTYHLRTPTGNLISFRGLHTRSTVLTLTTPGSGFDQNGTLAGRPIESSPPPNSKPPRALPPTTYTLTPLPSSPHPSPQAVHTNIPLNPTRVFASLVW